MVYEIVSFEYCEVFGGHKGLFVFIPSLHLRLTLGP